MKRTLASLVGALLLVVVLVNCKSKSKESVKSVVLYSKPDINCPYTAKAKAFMKAHGIKVEEKDFYKHKVELLQKGAKQGVKADMVPTVELADGSLFVGWDEVGYKEFLRVK